MTFLFSSVTSTCPLRDLPAEMAVSCSHPCPTADLCRRAQASPRFFLFHSWHLEVSGRAAPISGIKTPENLEHPSASEPDSGLTRSVATRRATVRVAFRPRELKSTGNLVESDRCGLPVGAGVLTSLRHIFGNFLRFETRILFLEY